MSKRANQINKKRMSFRWWNFLVILIVFFFCIRIGGQLIEYHQLKSEVEYYQTQLEIAQANYSVQLEEKNLLNDNTYLERLAREKLGMVMEGEEVVSVLDVNIEKYIASN